MLIRAEMRPYSLWCAWWTEQVAVLAELSQERHRLVLVRQTRPLVDCVGAVVAHKEPVLERLPSRLLVLEVDANVVRASVVG